jgi:protein-S-isoprenylcysteine O-methyltransferase Ste14
MNQEMKQSEGIDIKSLKRKAIFLVSLIYLILGLAFFLSAWTIKYWQGWAYILTIAIPMSIFGVYMFKHDPKLLERRLRTKEKRKEQKLIQKLGLVPVLLTFVLPGFDVRFGWSKAPVLVSIIGLALVLFGYLLTLYVFKINSFAARVVDVEKEQKVITTGPYALVRHPMYFALIFFYGASPLALGSYWALILALFIFPILIFRIKDEEKELLENLGGYRDYTQKVRYRLIPGIW